MKVAVIGASNKVDRYSYKAVILLKEKGHQVFPVHQRVKEIEGIKVYKSICEIDEDIDTVTMYVGEKISTVIGQDIVDKKPNRIIFNPGTENAGLESLAKKNGIDAVNACTLVMLKTGLF